TPTKTRRKFIKKLSLGVGSTLVGATLFNSTIAKSFIGPHSASQNKKLGIALVGLGQYSANQLAPALKETENCYLAGIVTGTPSTIDEWREKYDMPEKNVYDYDNFDQIANNQDIDIVYVVLPVSMHKEFTIRAAKAKKHVI